MRIGKIASIYSIAIGIAMLGMWTIYLLTGQVPEMKTTPVSIAFHIVSEVVTALSLLIGGYGAWTNKKWGLQAYLLSMGMLLYTLIMSPGYFVQNGDLAMAGMFGVLLVLAVAFIALSFLKTGEYAPEK